MAHVLNDRVKETTTSTGTGTINLAGADAGFETFVQGIGNSNTTYYAIAHQTANEFEIGIGTVTDASPDTLSRTTVISSTNSDNLVDFSAGTKDVFCTLPASKAVHSDSSGNVGIGLTSPSSPLHVRTGTNNNLEIQETGGDLRLLAINDARAANVPMEFAASQFDFLTGAVTVGDTAVANLKIGNSGDVIQVTAKKDGTDDIDMAFLTQASGGTTAEAMRIGSDGNIGIGTTNGDVASDGVAARTYVGIIGSSNRGVLNIGSTAANGADGGKISFVNGANAIADIYSDADSGSQTNGFLQFVTGQTARMRITSSGMVGIGTSDPDTDGYSYAEDLVIKAGASASDGAGLSINSVGRQYGVISFLDSAGAAGEIFYDHTTNYLYFKTNAVSKWSLDASGNMIAVGDITAFGSVSDERLKENIEVIDNPIDKVKQLKGVTFNYKKDGQKSTGLIAQDLEKVLPEAVYTSETIADGREGEESEEHLAIRYGNTVGLLVEAIKEQQKQIDTLNDYVKLQSATIMDMERRLNELEDK